MTLIEPDSPDDVINSQRYEAETDLTVDAAHTIVLYPVEKKYQKRNNTGHEDQHRHNGQNLRVHALQGLETLHPFLPVEMQPDVPNYDCCHQKRYDDVEGHIDREGDSQKVGTEAGFHLNPGGKHQDGEDQQGPVADSGLSFLFHRPMIS